MIKKNLQKGEKQQKEEKIEIKQAEYLILLIL